MMFYPEKASVHSTESVFTNFDNERKEAAIKLAMRPYKSVLATNGDLIIAHYKVALDALKKGSKIRSNYLSLVEMNNIYRAFVHNYNLDKEFKDVQASLLKVLLDIEARKNRAIFKNEFPILENGIEKFKILVESVDCNEFENLLQFVKDNSHTSKWIISSKKELKSSR